VKEEKKMENVIALGASAPNFVLDDQFGEEASLSGLKGKKVLLSFHPLAWTGICTQQMKNLDDLYAEFEGLNVVPFGLSVDASPAKKAWGDSMGLKNLRLLADFWPHGGAAESLGIFRNKDGISERANILIDEDGKVIWVKVYEIATLPEFDEILKFLKS